MSIEEEIERALVRAAVNAWHHKSARGGTFKDSSHVTPTDDEREVLAQIIDQTPATPGKGEKAGEFWADVVDAILSAGFRRTVQGEPSDAQLVAAINAHRSNRVLRDSTEHTAMRAALRAAAATQTGEKR